MYCLGPGIQLDVVEASDPGSFVAALLVSNTLFALRADGLDEITGQKVESQKCTRVPQIKYVSEVLT